MTVGETNYVARELDDSCLHSKADPEKRKARLARISDRLEHAFYTAHSETTRHQHAVKIGEQLARPFSADEQITRQP